MHNRVIYVDTDMELAAQVRLRLADLAQDVTISSDAQAALALSREHHFDAIVLDHDLSDCEGNGLLAQLQEQGIRVPVVYVIDTDEVRVVMEALRNGASDYVIKNIGDDYFPLLADAINQTVSNARLQRAKEDAEEELLRAKQKAEAMLAEMNHRVANSLALVSSLLRLQAGASQHDETRIALLETQSRISAIVGMHRSLYTNTTIGRVDMQAYVEALARDLSASITADGAELCLQVDTDPIELSADKAVSAGMVITELVTNALKYAYPQGQGGEIRILFKRVDDATARLAVEDDGVGLGAASAEATAHSTGLGTRIVQSMAASLGDGIAYPASKSGTVAQIFVALEL
jgi:two-component sensor histidine kinase/ActR/RegA family two-component response regulator